MGKTAKIWLLTAAGLVLAGCALFAGVMAARGWDFAGLSTVSYETNTHEIDVPFRGIALTTNTADIVLAQSEDGTCRVVCHEEADARHAVAVEQDVLTVTLDETGTWYDHIGLRFGAPRITVYLPETAYGALTVSESIGNVDVPGAFTFESVDITTGTGNVVFGAAAQETVTIRTGTGSVRFDGADAAELFVTTGTGNVTGSLRSGKVFLAQSDTGDVEVPAATTGGRCKIRTGTGDIRIEIG